jgi:hypothetical protein
LLGVIGCRSTPATSSDADASRFADSDASVFGADAPSLPALTIDNHGPGQFVLHAGVAIEVATGAFLERRSDDGRWSPYDDLEGGSGYRLVESCTETDPPPCRALRPSDVLVPEPWSGYSCGAQCNQSCDKDVFRPGVHRLVVQACDSSKSRFEGPSFEIPSTDAMLARQRIAADVVRAAIVRLDARRAREAPEAQSSNRRAGFAILAGTEQIMEVDGRSELVKWLRKKEGFKEGVADAKKNCSSQPMVGFALTSSAAPGKERAAEIVIEFGCNRVTIVHQQAGRRVTSSSFFDPSRSVIVGIASRGLPADGDLNRLQ